MPRKRPNGANTFDDTWEWDGTSWIQRAPVAIPPGSSTHDVSFDKARKLTIAFGSMGTWDYGPVVAARCTPFGSGCPTSASVPVSAPLTLAPLPWAGPWLGERFETDFQHQPPLSLGIFLWGFSNTTSVFGSLPFNLALFGSPNCSMQVSADVTELIFPGTTRYVSFVLPNHPSFRITLPAAVRLPGAQPAVLQRHRLARTGISGTPPLRAMVLAPATG